MTGWGVQRTPRTAYPTSVPPVASALMPPHSQGAERRTERRAGRTGSRWGLRALVIGGLAGAAWLLTGAAAYAADRDATPEGSPLGSSLIGSVVHGDTAPSAVNRVLKAAAQPLESENHAHQHHATSSVLATPVRVLSQPAAVLTGTLDEATRSTTGTSDTTTALDAVDRVVRDLSGPLRLTGGPTDSRPLAPVAAPLTRTLRPVTDLLPDAAVPVPVTQRLTSTSVVRTTATRATTGAAVTGTGPAHRVPAAGHPAGDRDTVATIGSTGQRHMIVADRHPATVPASAPDTVREYPPGGDGPAPLRVYLGAVSGISTTSASGAPTEGGSAAFLPAAVASSTMAVHRLCGATDVEVRRHDAEAPTVSPD
jgi:hypothetical protein